MSGCLANPIPHTGCDTMLAGCLVEVVKRNLNDTEAEMLYEKGKLEQREAPRIGLQENSAYHRATGKFRAKENFSHVRSSGRPTV